MRTYDNDPRIRQVQALRGADEIWEEVDGLWVFERYGEGWCAIELINTLRRPSAGNPFATLDEAVSRVLGGNKP